MENQTLNLVRRLLASQTDGIVQVDLQQEMDSPHVVLRCAVQGDGLPESVIVKHAVDNDEQAHYHFRNELATLRFMNAIGAGKLVPQVYAADVADNLLVMEDFGDSPSLLDLLQADSDSQQAAASLVNYGAYLGRFHAANVGREVEFQTLCDSLGASAPSCDTSQDVRIHADHLQALFTALAIEIPSGFRSELNMVARLMHEPGPFRVLAHCDAGPHNVLCPDDRTVLIDYEFGQYACGIMDLVSARMGFPHTLNMGRVPLPIVQQLEQAYLNEFPQAVDIFNLHLAAACAHWALGRLRYYWQGYLKDYLKTGDAINAKFPNYQRTRRHQLTYIQSAGNTFIEFDCFPALYHVFEQLEQKLLSMWSGLEPVDYYPVFGGK